MYLHESGGGRGVCSAPAWVGFTPGFLPQVKSEYRNPGDLSRVRSCLSSGHDWGRHQRTAVSFMQGPMDVPLLLL